jgi:hypothetical protein
MSAERSIAGLAHEIAGDRVDRIVFAATAMLVAFGYSVLLPFGFTQRISLANWRYLDGRYIAFSIAFALSLGWLITVQVHAPRGITRAAAAARAASGSGPLGAFGALVSVLPSLLCCSPILPTIVGVVGLSASSRLSTTASLQSFFATKETLILTGALALMLATGAWSTRKVARCYCTTLDGCQARTSRPGRPVKTREEVEREEAR